MILGIKIMREGCQIKLLLDHYIEIVLNQFSMLETTLVSIPMEPGMKFANILDKKFHN